MCSAKRAKSKNMTTQCPRCYIKYNSETIQHCPICAHRFSDIKDDIESREVKYMNSLVRGLKSMVSASQKGKPHKSSSGTRLIDPWVGHHSLTIRT